ncbi:MAG: hypothetical protein HF307_19465 [Ignavibacteria bacterium]|jgi:competence transcription factor ComK|nr:hypothetical protein [Ignavibacteria bacterium]
MDTLNHAQKEFLSDLDRKEAELMAKAGESAPDETIPMRVYNSESDLRKDAQSDPNLINLPDLIDKNCKKCYGRGHVGKNIKTDGYIFCGCLIKNYRDRVRQFEEIEAEQTKVQCSCGETLIINGSRVGKCAKCGNTIKIHGER